MTRALLAAIGLAAMAAAGASLLLTLPAGFPDGYISPYDRATGLWATVGTYALLVLGLFTLVAAVMRKLGRSAIGAALCVVLFAALWLLDSCPRVAWCSSAVQQMTGVMLDDGQGG